MHSLILLIILFCCCQPGLKAQEEIIPREGKGYATGGFNLGLWQYKGDVAKSSMSPSPTNFQVYGGYAYNGFSAEVGYMQGVIAWNQRAVDNPANFRARVQGTQLSFTYCPLPNQLISPLIGLGIGYSWFSSYTDLKDKEGLPYWYWNDGTIRDISQFSVNPSDAKQLQRDYVYESPLAIKQTSVYFPVQVGFQGRFSRSLSFRMTWNWLLLQSDNMDRNTTTPAWDRLKGLSAGITWNFSKPVKRAGVPVGAPKSVRSVDYSSVDYKKLLAEDEDKDGIPDIDDWCFGTPPGAPVNQHGCIADMDEDGVGDYIDKELLTSPNAWVDSMGVTLSDEEVQKQYNDSLSYFVGPLRKFNKNSRPYPVKKYIPSGNFVKYANMLEAHPEWKIAAAIAPPKMPAEFRIMDLNGDGFLTMEELQISAHRLLDGTSTGLTPELLTNAINYAFQVQ